MQTTIELENNLTRNGVFCALSTDHRRRFRRMRCFGLVLCSFLAGGRGYC